MIPGVPGKKPYIHCGSRIFISPGGIFVKVSYCITYSSFFFFFFLFSFVGSLLLVWCNIMLITCGVNRNRLAGMNQGRRSWKNWVTWTSPRNRDSSSGIFKDWVTIKLKTISPTSGPTTRSTMVRSLPPLHPEMLIRPFLLGKVVKLKNWRQELQYFIIYSRVPPNKLTSHLELVYK